MVNWHIIFKIIGSLLFIEAFFMSWCVGVSFYFQDVVGPKAYESFYQLLLSVKQKSPEVEIPEFRGSNENVSVYHTGDGNKIGVQFNKGITKADLVLGTFSISWKGKSPLDEGVYKAKVSVVYSTP